MHADWVEHVLETGGEAYMRTPADQLNILVRNSIDTYGFLMGCLGVLLLSSWKAACTAIAWSSRRLLAGKAKLA